MYIIVGLGNPGKDYKNTRHNIGFDVIDVIADKANISVMEKKHKCYKSCRSDCGSTCNYYLCSFFHLKSRVLFILHGP